MTFSLHQGRVVKSDNTHTHTHTHTIINIHPFAHILDNCALIFNSCALFTAYPNQKITSPGDNHQSMGGQSKRTQGQAKMAT